MIMYIPVNADRALNEHFFRLVKQDEDGPVPTFYLASHKRSHRCLMEHPHSGNCVGQTPLPRLVRLRETVQCGMHPSIYEGDESVGAQQSAEPQPYEDL